MWVAVEFPSARGGGAVSDWETGVSFSGLLPWLVVVTGREFDAGLFSESILRCCDVATWFTILVNTSKGFRMLFTVADKKVLLRFREWIARVKSEMNPFRISSLAKGLGFTGPRDVMTYSRI